MLLRWVIIGLGDALRLQGDDSLLEQLEVRGRDGREFGCDVLLDGTLCYGPGGQHVLAANAELDDTVARYTFDEHHMIDHSGSWSHGLVIDDFQRLPGPPGRNLAIRVGTGHATALLELDKTNQRNVLTRGLSMSFWLFINGQWADSGRFCPLVQLTSEGRSFLEVALSVTDSRMRVVSGGREAEFADSNSSVPKYRWTHIVVNFTFGSGRLFVNGIHDMTFEFSSQSDLNVASLSLTIGSKDEGCRRDYAAIDDLTLLTRELEKVEILAMAGNNIEGHAPISLALGCTRCSANTASCPDGYKICEDENRIRALASANGYPDPVGLSTDGSKNAEGTVICCI